MDLKVGDKVEISHSKWASTIEGEITDLDSTTYTVSSGYSTHYVEKNDPDWGIKKLGESPLTPKKSVSNGCECGAAITYGANTNLHAHWCPKYRSK